MKYALLICSFLLTISTTSVEARDVTSFKKSDSILTLAQFLFEVAPDLPESVRLSDMKISSVDYSQCQKVSSIFVLETLEQSIRTVLRYYPDEEVPFEQAIYDLEEYLDGATFFKCELSKKTKYTNIRITYFVDLDDKIHLRLDKITPLQE